MEVVDSSEESIEVTTPEVEEQHKGSVAKEQEEEEVEDDDHDTSGTWLFQAMIKMPWPFLIVLPVIFLIFLIVGWTREDLVEENVGNLWIPTSGEFHEDTQYVSNLGENDFDSTAFLAMAISNDDENTNLFTSEKLEEIRQRMEIAEATTVTYKGNTYTWDDVCMDNSISRDTNYLFPCVRLSPMDLFQEARWFFNEVDKVTWYQEVIRKNLVQPFISRVGILQEFCTSVNTTNATTASATNEENALPCDHQVRLRADVEYATSHGYPPEYASPAGLIGDVGSLDLIDPCRICIEQELDSAMKRLYEEIIPPFFEFFAWEMERAIPTISNAEQRRILLDLKDKATQLAETITKQDVEEFFLYYVLRSMYSEMGGESYLVLYKDMLNSPLSILCGQSSVTCPPRDITLEEAKRHLLEHADNTFSSLSTAGAPFPMWSKDPFDGSVGYLLSGNHPAGGSGINMSASLWSIIDYFDLWNISIRENFYYWNVLRLENWSPMYATRSNGTGNNNNNNNNNIFNTGNNDDIFSNGNNNDDNNNTQFYATGALTRDELWISMVERNPIYAWFMASLEPMTSHCGNENLPGSNTGQGLIDTMVAPFMEDFSRRWCTKYSIPFEEDETYTKQHFAKMWYDLLLDSESFLNVTQGTSDPYTWTLGVGCGYTLGGQRDAYTGQNEQSILQAASQRELYYIDEGTVVGAIDRNLLMGDVIPPIGEYGKDGRPLEHVGVIQAIYPTLTGSGIVQRVQNCNRPTNNTGGGGPIYNLTEEEGNDILYLWKEAFENSWTGHNVQQANQTVQFLGYYDDAGVIGTSGRFLRDVTLTNGKLTTISIFIIAIFSIIFLFSRDPVESRVLITIIGVILIIIAYFAALGLSLISGIKQNITIAWTLPFIILGLGVDDMYIVLMALQKQNDYSEKSFLNAMKEVVVPVTITSLVNASMFAIMNISNIPAVALTSRVALICVVFLYLVIIFCFPAYCYLDMRRQAANKYDVLFCKTARNNDDNDNSNQGATHDFSDEGKTEKAGENNKKKANGDNSKRSETVGTFLASIMYEKMFKPLLLGKEKRKRSIMHGIILGLSLLLFVLGIYGITQRRVGLGLEEFFPADHQAGIWATIRTEELASWSIAMNWGELDYADPDIQMYIIKQFEDVVSTSHVAQVDTRSLWIANLVMWTTRLCGENVVRADPNIYECGMDQVYNISDFETCSGTWKLNKYGLQEKAFAATPGNTNDTCQAFEGGICRPTSQMHVQDLIDLGVIPDNVTKPGPEYENEVWCPVFEGWSNQKLQFCIERWRNLTGGSGGLVLDDDHGTPSEDCSGVYYNDETVRVPLPYSVSPMMFGIHLNSHEDTLDLIRETREICDDDPVVHCWMTGTPYYFWSQYLEVFSLLLQIGGVAILIGFVVSLSLLFTVLKLDGHHLTGKIFGSSMIGALLIALTNLLSLVTVSGLSVLAGVNLTGFSVMSFVLSVAFSVEYAVHVVSRWLRANMSIKRSLDRVDYTMSFLMLPTFMSFISSLVGVVCLAFTELSFSEVFFFRPLIIVMFITYFYGCYWLPVTLIYIDFDIVKVGKITRSESSSRRLRH